MIIKFKKTHPKAKIPAYALPGDAGMDLFSIEKKTIRFGEVCVIKTGIDMELPTGTVGLIWDKGGLAAKNGIHAMGGVFDENYRGEIGVTLTNLSKIPHTFDIGDKIAQLLIQKIEYPTIKVTKILSKSVRGKKRFGSTGKR